jgi:hypothetical protein
VLKVKHSAATYELRWESCQGTRKGLPSIEKTASVAGRQISFVMGNLNYFLDISS